MASKDGIGLVCSSARATSVKSQQGFQANWARTVGPWGPDVRGSTVRPKKVDSWTPRPNCLGPDCSASDVRGPICQEPVVIEWATGVVVQITILEMLCSVSGDMAYEQNLNKDNRVALCDISSTAVDFKAIENYI